MKKIKYFVMSILILCAAVGLSACGTAGNGDDAQVTDASTTDEVISTTVDTANSGNEETSAEDDNKVHYTVKVVDEAGNPIAGAMVQLCDESCYPGKTNDEGIAEFSIEAADYKASLMTLPEGYEYSGEETQFHFEDGSDELTITLKTAS